MESASICDWGICQHDGKAVSWPRAQVASVLCRICSDLQASQGFAWLGLVFMLSIRLHPIDHVEVKGQVCFVHSRHSKLQAYEV